MAASNGVTIVYEGSQLSHVGTALDSSGARVVHPAWDPEAAQDAQVFRKLVRDRIPAKIEGGGERAFVQAVTGEALIRLLRQKLVEEALEVAGARSREDLVEEIADLQEVVFALLQASAIEQTEVERVASSKRERRGGFSGGTVLLRTERDYREAASVPDHERLEFELGDADEATATSFLTKLAALEPVPKVLPGDEIELSLIPPFPGYGSREFNLALPSLSLSLTARYTEKALNIRITRRRSSSFVPEQLDLLPYGGDAGPVSHDLGDGAMYTGDNA
jgi:predicted house-cleaning noncanonical NTP pyrophosphatase (MazG superfamily)